MTDLDDLLNLPCVDGIVFPVDAETLVGTGVLVYFEVRARHDHPHPDSPALIRTAPGH